MILSGLLQKFVKNNMKNFFKIFLFGFVFAVLSLPVSVKADATLSISPSGGSYAVGDTFSVLVSLSTGGESINAGTGEIHFDTSLLQVTNLGYSQSIFSLWTENPSFSNSAGTVNFSGGVPNPGYNGSSGAILRITFKTKAVGQAEVSFNSGSVLANDGQGTNILKNKNSATYTVSAKSISEQKSETTIVPSTIITSSTHPDQEKWYKSKDVSFSFSVPQEATLMRVLFDQKSASVPIETTEIRKNIEYTDVADGVWYLHLRFQDKNGWGVTQHFRVRIDAVPPVEFVVKFPHGDSSEDPRPVVLFNTRDALSGISHYNVRIGDKEYTYIDPALITSNPYTPPPQNPGVHIITVEAVDKAGNITINTGQFEISSIAIPRITFYSDSMIEGDILKVRGISYPSGRVDILLKDKNGKTFSEYTVVNSLGDFALSWSKRLNSGVYTLTAQVTDLRGAKSLESEPLTVVISERPLFMIGKIAVTYLGLIILTLGTFISIVFGLWYAWYKFLLFKKRLEKDIIDADHTIHKAFTILSNDIEAEVKSLEKARSKRSLSKEEERIISKFQKNFSDTENILEKKINSIQKSLE